MKPSFRTGLSALLLSSLCALALPAAATETPAAPATALPSTSLYQLPAALSNQDGKAFKLRELRGRPVLVSMFYNSCEFVCPMLIDTMRLTQQALDQDSRERLSMLLITFDPARDDIKTLKTVARQRELDPARWTLARTDAASVRKIAATLDIQYRRLESGEYNHTTVLVLLDADGRVLGRTRTMGAVDPEFVKLVHDTIAATPASPAAR
ncbi:MAG: SCO family protein [Pseudomonadota bacterium]